MTFKPDSRKHANEVCRGIRIGIHDAPAVRPVAFGLLLVATVARQHPDQFEWLRSFDRLAGDARVREQITADPAGFVGRIEEWTKANGWADRVRPHLLYQ